MFGVPDGKRRAVVPDSSPQKRNAHVKALWRDLGRICEERGLNPGQLHNRIGDPSLPLKTLRDRLREGRGTTWPPIRQAVLALGLVECDWKGRYERARCLDDDFRRRLGKGDAHTQGQDESLEEREQSVPLPQNLPLQNGEASPRETADDSSGGASGWGPKRVMLVVCLAAVLLVGAAVLVWRGQDPPSVADGPVAVNRQAPGRGGKDVACARVSHGAVRVYYVPGQRRQSFLKREGQRILYPTPVQETATRDGHRYRLVLTPSRHEGLGWIRSDTGNLTDGC